MKPGGEKRFPKVLVTGGAGFIGSHLSRGLVSRGYKVSIFDNLSTGKLDGIKELLSPSGAEFIFGDILNSEMVRKACRSVDAVIHLAAIKDVQFSIQNPTITHQVNVVGTKNLLDACVSSGVRRFLLVSTSAVYGDAKYLPVDEGHPLNPLSAYASTKIQSETQCLESESRSDMETRILRLFNVYGKSQGVDSYSGVITKFIDRIRSGNPAIIYGDGIQTRDFVNVKDVVGAITLALEIDTVKSRVFNIGSGEAVRILDLAKIVAELEGESDKVIHEAGRSGEILQSVADIRRAKNELGFIPSIGLKNGLLELVS